MSSAIPKLFHPVRVGTANLQHRVVLAPMTRYRNTVEHVPTELLVEYYKQRSSVPGSLVITEATIVSPRAGGYALIPGIWSDEQIAGWKPVVDAVHSNGSFIFLQLWALGRTADHKVLQAESGHRVVSASDIPIPDHAIPHPLSVDEIKEFVNDFGTAAGNAVKAGFDGVEIHGANGYLVDQFLQTNSNRRTDEYGGSVENRVRFALEVTDACVKAIGANKVAIRLSPWSNFQGMRMPDPVPTFTEVVTRLRDNHPDLAYIHVVESDLHKKTERAAEESNQFLRDIWGDRPYITCSDFDRDSAIDYVEKHGGLVAFGRPYTSNPDLPLRLKDKLDLTPYDYSTFYTHEAKGYTDFPFAVKA